MVYHIKCHSDRVNTNLTLHTTAIRTGVLAIFPTAVVNIYVDYFEVLNVPHATNKDLRAMGKEIAANSQFLNSLEKTYGKSNQIFVAC